VKRAKRKFLGLSKMYLVICVLFLVLSVHCSSVPKDYVRVPSGRLFHKSCVHHVPSGAVVSTENNHTIVSLVSGEVIKHPPCPYPVIKPGPLHGPAWKAWAEYNNSAAVTRLTTAWTVPPSPPSFTNQILYYWNGIEPTQNTAVLQPVLQFGETPAGGDNYWAIASWYVSDITAQFSDLVKCTINTVVGDLSVDNSGSWTVTGVCSPQKTVLTYNPKDTPYTWAYPCVLEAYEVTDCNNQYPSSNKLSFTNVQVEVAGSQVTPTWVPQTKNNLCQEHVTVTSTQQVTLIWNSP